MSSYDENCKLKEDQLKPLLTDKFLETLLESVKVCGWSVDYCESLQFVEYCFELTGKELLLSDMECYEYDEE